MFILYLITAWWLTAPLKNREAKVVLVRLWLNILVINNARKGVACCASKPNFRIER